jgi:hypothetical protein
MNKWKRVYVCSPLRADNWPGILRNALKAQNYMEQAAAKYGCRAVAPHAYLPYLLDDNDPMERALALDFGKKLLALCDALIVCGDVISQGMRGEIQQAHELGISVLALDESASLKVSIQITMEGKSS